MLVAREADMKSTLLSSLRFFSLETSTSPRPSQPTNPRVDFRETTYLVGEPTNDEREPARTTNARAPLVVVEGGTLFRVWADSRLRFSPAEQDDVTHWIIKPAKGRPASVPLDCDDTIVEILRAIRAGQPQVRSR
jgi:hypothetical protein